MRSSLSRVVDLVEGLREGAALGEVDAGCEGGCEEGCEVGGSGLEGREVGAAVLETEPLRDRPWPWRAARGGVAMGDLGNMGISGVGVSGLVWLGRREVVLVSLHVWGYSLRSLRSRELIFGECGGSNGWLLLWSIDKCMHFEK